MAHAVTGRRFARGDTPTGAAGERLAPDDLELSARSARVWAVLLSDTALVRAATAPSSRIRHKVYHLTRAEHRIDPLEAVAALFVHLAACGATEAQLRPALLFLDEVLRSCYTGRALRTIHDLDRAELPLDHAEDLVTQQRHLAEAVGAPILPELLDAQAEADEQGAAILLERAHVARREARRQRREGRHGPAWASRRRGQTAVVGAGVSEARA